MITLTIDQELALKQIEQMSPGEIVFLTGDAGTGKSMLVELFYSRRQGGGIIRLAPTGLAAQNIDGRPAQYNDQAHHLRRRNTS